MPVSICEWRVRIGTFILWIRDYEVRERRERRLKDRIRRLKVLYERLKAKKGDSEEQPQDGTETTDDNKQLPGHSCPHKSASIQSSDNSASIKDLLTSCNLCTKDLLTPNNSNHIKNLLNPPDASNNILPPLADSSIKELLSKTDFCNTVQRTGSDSKVRDLMENYTNVRELLIPSDSCTRDLLLSPISLECNLLLPNSGCINERHTQSDTKTKDLLTRVQFDIGVMTPGSCSELQTPCDSDIKNILTLRDSVIYELLSLENSSLDESISPNAFSISKLLKQDDSFADELLSSSDSYISDILSPGDSSIQEILSPGTSFTQNRLSPGDAITPKRLSAKDSYTHVILSPGESNTKEEILSPGDSNTHEMLSPGESYTHEMLSPGKSYTHEMVSPGESYTHEMLSPGESYAHEMLSPGESYTHEMLSPGESYTHEMPSPGEFYTHKLLTPGDPVITDLLHPVSINRCDLYTSREPHIDNVGEHLCPSHSSIRSIPTPEELASFRMKLLGQIASVSESTWNRPFSGSVLRLSQIYETEKGLRCQSAGSPRLTEDMMLHDHPCLFEMLIVKAGDVELNPGPHDRLTDSLGLQESELVQLAEDIPVPSYTRFCIALGFSYTQGQHVLTEHLRNISQSLLELLCRWKVKQRDGIDCRTVLAGILGQAGLHALESKLMAGGYLAPDTPLSATDEDKPRPVKNTMTDEQIAQ